MFVSEIEFSYSRMGLILLHFWHLSHHFAKGLTPWVTPRLNIAFWPPPALTMSYPRFPTSTGQDV
jgi:hypothetical protein